MSSQTDKLIDELSRTLEPAVPLRHPFVRAAAWTGGGLLYVTLVVMFMTRDGVLAMPWSDVPFALQQLAALASAGTAAAAAFSLTVPGRGRRPLLAAAAAAGVWLGLVVSGCIRDWMIAGDAGLALRSDWACVIGIPLTAVLPALALTVMLRRGAPLVPRMTTATGGCAVASLASLAMCVAQPHERDIVVLVWHGATIAAMSVLAGLAGRSILHWTHLTAAAGAAIAFAIVSPTGAAQQPARQASAPVVNVQALGPQVGARIPDFTLVDQNGATRTLRSLMGPKGLMLVLFRSADW
jgi:hypothetical protein